MFFNAINRLEKDERRKMKNNSIKYVVVVEEVVEEINKNSPILLPSIISKLFEKLLLEPLTSIVTKQNLYPSNQFEFSRVTNIIKIWFEGMKICSALVLNMSQAIEKV